MQFQITKLLTSFVAEARNGSWQKLYKSQTAPGPPSLA